MAYIYRADIYCDDCGRAICKRLQAAGKAPADPDNGWSYDSDDYPKRAGDDEESDTPEHCAAGERCVNANPDYRTEYRGMAKAIVSKSR